LVSVPAEISHLRFRLIAAVADEVAQMAVVHYAADRDEPPRRACEIFRFAGELKIAGEAPYGAISPRP